MSTQNAATARPMHLVHWPECRGGSECRCVESGSVILSSDDDPMRGLGVTYIKTDDVELVTCYFCHKLIDASVFACPRCGWKVGA